MQPAPIGKIKSIFLHARELGPGRAAAYLDQACAGDPDLRLKIERLLEQDAASEETDFLSPQVSETTTATMPRVLAPGELVGGRFRIARFVGRGGMGDVYEAEDTELGGRVALKTIRPTLVGDPQTIGRFKREIQLSRQVTHPNICRVFDVGHDKDLTFLTMEFLDGETLSVRLARDGKFTEPSAIELLRQMAGGLDALHHSGIVHRDLKPGNVMLVNTSAGGTRAVIADFGLAQSFHSPVG